MVGDLWEIKEHIISASYRRALPRGVKDESARLRLHVKQWIPKANSSPQSGDATIIFAHGVGSSKESYEVFFHHLIRYHPRIRSIFAMDAANHGQSYMLNKEVLGDEPGWHDTARDILQMVNSFQDEMRPPILGVAQSWGGQCLLMASEMHPRLFDGLVLIEPPVGMDFKSGLAIKASWMMHRADWWPTRETARENLLKLKYYRRFDPQVFDRVMQYDLRDVTIDNPPPSELGVDPTSSTGVTLTTPKAQEAYTVVMDHLDLPGHVSVPPAKANSVVKVIPGFYRPEFLSVQRLLPTVFPPVLYIWGELSDLLRPPGGAAYRDYLLQTTGASDAGSGGIARGKVAEAWVKGSTHTIPFEKPEGLAKALIPWLEQRHNAWLEEQVRNEKQVFYTAKIKPNWLSKVNKL